MTAYVSHEHEICTAEFIMTRGLPSATIMDLGEMVWLTRISFVDEDGGGGSR